MNAYDKTETDHRYREHVVAGEGGDRCINFSYKKMSHMYEM